MKRAAIYARVSTLHQSETSIETQIETCKKFCEERHFEVARIFSDKQSGGKADREGLNEMVERALNGEYDVIVVDKYDRFFRESIEDRIATKKLEEKGILVLSATEQFDVTRPSGRLARWIMSDVNAFVRENIREEVIKKTAAAARKGYWMGGKPPFGYSLKEIKDPEAQGRHRKVLVINEEEAPYVRKIFEMFANGHSYREIVKFLNEHNVKTKRGNSWEVASVYDLLHNEKYSGIYTYAKGYKRSNHIHRSDTIRVEGAVPAIISKDIWQRVKSRFKVRISTAKRNYILRGIAKCGDCGGPMVGNRGYYICSNYKNGKDVMRVEISQRKLENFVNGYIENIFANMENADFEEIVKEINRIAEQKNLIKQRKIQELLFEKSKTEKAIDNIVDAIAEGGLTERLKEKAKELEEKLKKINEKIVSTSAPQKYVTTEELESRWKYLKEKFAEDKREVILSLIREVKVYKSGYIEIKAR